LIPYWIIIVIALLIISHQTFYKGNSPRSWYSMVVCIGGYLTIGSGCVVIGQLAYSFLQVSTPNPDSLLTVAITCGMFIGPLFCGILLVFFGLMHRANNLIRLSVMFLAIGACLVWASYYVGPGIALIGAFLPSNKWIPFHLCCSWLKDIDDENRETTIKAEADVDWDKRYEEEEKKNQAKAVAARALAEKQEASAAAARAAGGDEDDIRLAMGPDATLEPETGISDPLLAGISDPAIVGSSQPFPSDSGIQLISADQDGDDDDSTETDPGPSMAASSSGIHQQREDIDD
ncbi:MAG: hypothetical protein Q8P67_23560, partial [archaeon]|nr:hypothetical protein [archaeon]